MLFFTRNFLSNVLNLPEKIGVIEYIAPIANRC
jgi:hypothetical protein